MSDFDDHLDNYGDPGAGTSNSCDCNSETGVCCHNSDHCYCVEEGEPA